MSHLQGIKVLWFAENWPMANFAIGQFSANHNLVLFIFLFGFWFVGII